MKKAFIVAAVILFFVLILAVALFKLFKTSPNKTTSPVVQYPVATNATGTNEQDPQQYTKNFYQWYLLNISRNPAFPYTNDLNQTLGPWLTPEFVASWNERVTDFEADPVLLTTEDPSAWGTAITTQITSQSVRTATVLLSIGSSGQHVFSVDLVRSAADGTWKISAVSFAGH